MPMRHAKIVQARSAGTGRQRGKTWRSGGPRRHLTLRRQSVSRPQCTNFRVCRPTNVDRGDCRCPRFRFRSATNCRSDRGSRLSSDRRAHVGYGSPRASRADRFSRSLRTTGEALAGQRRCRCPKIVPEGVEVRGLRCESRPACVAYPGSRYRVGSTSRRIAGIRESRERERSPASG
jgi:hypothetical protein